MFFRTFAGQIVFPFIVNGADFALGHGSVCVNRHLQRHIFLKFFLANNQPTHGASKMWEKIFTKTMLEAAAIWASTCVYIELRSLYIYIVGFAYCAQRQKNVQNVGKRDSKCNGTTTGRWAVIASFV